VARAPFHLFTPPEAVRRVYPASIDYYLRGAAKSVSVEVLDAAGTVVRRQAGAPMSTAGSHRVKWDLRYPGATVFPGMVLRSAAPEMGPLAPPGRYQVRLTVDGQSQTRDLLIVKDPRLKDVTQADFDEQFALTVQIRDKTSAANEAVLRIRDLKKQMLERAGAARDQAITTAAESLSGKLSAIEEQIYQVKNESEKDVFNYPIRLNNRLAALMRVAQNSEARPTDQTSTVFKELSEELDTQIRALDTVVQTDLARFNSLLAARKLEAVR